ncbi:hypothetical protein PVK06_035351 [Gossypium arboreum]|uniref:Uncharacterized protein n=1 Tax=Gossypium arboreum TaxID=29729 RepID=A0ABR0NH48_GOSAR|nr:hypothetical protein PVK06_035351 [Gossypium arboreum]
MNVFTNHPVSSLCNVSSFQVSRNPIDKLQLYYLSDERQFRLLEKGKNIDDLNTQVSKGKQGKGLMLFEFQQFHLIDEKARNLVDERAPRLDLVDIHNPIDDVILHIEMKCFSTNKYDLGEIVNKILCEFGLFPLKKKVRPISIFDPGLRR